jgi:hypothetical protein
MRNYITRDLAIGLQRCFMYCTIFMSTIVTFIVLLHRFDSKYDMYQPEYLNYLSNEALQGSGMWFTFVSCFLVLLFLNNARKMSDWIFKA